jgi:hypothetical protein
MQVHKAKLRGGSEEGGSGRSRRHGPFAFLLGRRSGSSSRSQQQGPQQTEELVVGEGQGAWDVCNLRGVTLDQLADLNLGEAFS